MSDIMNDILTKALDGGESEVEVQLKHFKGIKNPTIQMLVFKNDIGDIITGNFMPAKDKSISNLLGQNTATLKGCDFMEDIQDVTLNGIKGILTLERNESYNLKTRDKLTAHITGKSYAHQEGMNVNIIMMVPGGKRCLEGLFILSEHMPYDPFQGKHKSTIEIIRKQDNLHYYCSLIGRDNTGEDMKLEGVFKMDGPADNQIKLK